jgi:hypothetical protein
MLWMALMADQLKIGASQTIDLSAVIFLFFASPWQSTLAFVNDF